jgi:hypothetical protein
LPRCRTESISWSKEYISDCPLSPFSDGTVIRVARWFIFRPKIPIWVYFGVP